MSASRAGKRGCRGARLAPPTFIQAIELAHHLDCDTTTLYRWAADGLIPPPHSRIGERTSLWLRRHYEEFVRTGRWPEEAYARGHAGHTEP